MSSARYERLPTTPNDDRDDSSDVELNEPRAPPVPVDPRFEQPPVAAWKRVGLILFIAFMFWLSFNLRKPYQTKPKVVHANRYSKEHKYRPAASPIITEKLKDGRTRVRGAQPTIYS